MSQTDEKLNLRLPPGLRDRIRQAAGVNHRTMNAEAVFRLERDFENEKGPVGSAIPPSQITTNPSRKDEGDDV